MGMPCNTPGYLHHRPSNRGYARFGGRAAKPVYFPGPYNSPQSRAAYAAALAEWRAGVRSAVSPGEAATVRQVLAAWVTEARQRYRKYGRLTSEWYCHVSALGPLRELYADLPARAFGPRQLAAVRQRMVDLSWVRKTINRQVGRIRTVWRWAESQELLPAGSAAALATLEGLRAGRTAAPDGEPRRPVTWRQLLAVLRRCGPACGALVRLQWLTGCRPGEACALRPCDVEHQGELWLYRVRPEAAKTGKEIYWLGPRAQRVLSPLLGGDPEAPAFGLTLRRYRREVVACCRAGGAPKFHLHELRHTNAVCTANRYGIEGAAQRLNHADQRTTKIYTGAADQLARRIARERG